MNEKISRRKLITKGLAGIAGLSGLAVAARLGFGDDGLAPLLLQHLGECAHVQIGADARRVRRDQLDAAGRERLRGGRERQQQQ